MVDSRPTASGQSEIESGPFGWHDTPTSGPIYIEVKDLAADTLVAEHSARAQTDFASLKTCEPPTAFQFSMQRKWRSLIAAGVAGVTPDLLPMLAVASLYGSIFVYTARRPYCL
jgi:hypothetical protein